MTYYRLDTTHLHPIYVWKVMQIIFHFLHNQLAHCGIFKNGVLLMYTLQGVSSVANFITAYEQSQ